MALALVPGFPAAEAGMARPRSAATRRAIAPASLATRLPLPEYVIALGETELAAGPTAAARRDLALVAAEQQLQRAAGVDIDVELAVFEADHGDPQRAVELARRGWDAAPSVRAADALGWALTRSGDAEAGLRWSAGRCGSGSLDPIWRAHAGLSALAAGRRSEGRGSCGSRSRTASTAIPWQAQRVRRRAGSDPKRRVGALWPDIMSLPTLLNTVARTACGSPRARRSVLEALLAAEQPLTAEEIAGDADLASTYRNLETLESIGIVRHVHLGHGPGRYELTRPQRRLGDLRGCGRSTPLPSAGASGDPPRRARGGRLRAALHALPDRRSLHETVAAP